MTTRQEIRELELLLAQFVDEGSPPESVKRLHELLLDKPELQACYWKWIDVHVLLGAEGPALLESSGAWGALTATVASRPESTTEESAAALLVASGQSRRAIWNRALAWASIAGAIVIAASFLLGRASSPDPTVAQSTEERAADAGGSAVPRGDEDAAEIEGPWRIPQITRVKWTGPYFADSIEHDLVSAEVRPGRVSLQLSSGAAVSGYLLKLGPGEGVDMVVTAEARSENNVSVTELDSTGAPLQRSVTFNNFKDSGGIDGARGTGLLGTWCASNDTRSPKYYLITGGHQVVDPDALSDLDDVRWRMSSMEIVLEEPDVVILGWDDGGIESFGLGQAIEADQDFDDVSAILRIASRHDRVGSDGRDLRVVGAAAAVPGRPRTEQSRAYDFTIHPGEVVGIVATSSAGVANNLYLANATTDDLLWSTGSESAQLGNFGGVLVENLSETAIELSLFGEHLNDRQIDPPPTWICSMVKELYKQRGCTIVGFEDLGEDNDFNDVRVTMVHFSRGRDKLIDTETPEEPSTAEAP